MVVQQCYCQDIGNKVILQYLPTQQFRHVLVPYWAYIERKILLRLKQNNSSAVYISATYANLRQMKDFSACVHAEKKATAKYKQKLYIKQS